MGGGGCSERRGGGDGAALSKDEFLVLFLLVFNHFKSLVKNKFNIFFSKSLEKTKSSFIKFNLPI